jgi:hypothetical protein
MTWLAPAPSPRRAHNPDKTRQNWALTGQNRGPRPGHHWGLFHGHGHWRGLRKQRANGDNAIHTLGVQQALIRRRPDLSAVRFKNRLGGGSGRHRDAPVRTSPSNKIPSQLNHSGDVRLCADTTERPRKLTSLVKIDEPVEVAVQHAWNCARRLDVLAEYGPQYSDCAASCEFCQNDLRGRDMLGSLPGQRVPRSSDVHRSRGTQR